jgi:hypothetical protein
MHMRRAGHVVARPLNCGVIRIEERSPVAVLEQRVLLARIDYVGGACLFAVLAAALTRIRDSSGLVPVLFAVVLPTALVAIVASLKLIRPKGLAALGTWLICGVLVPIVAVVGFMEANFLQTFIDRGHMGPRHLYWVGVGVGALITVPVGLIGHVLLRWFISRRFE